MAADMAEDWSLQAIVGGYSGDFSTMMDVEMDGHDPFLQGPISAHPPHQQELFADGGFLAGSFPDVFDVSINGSSDELEDLYKPFLGTTSSSSLPARTVLDFQEQMNNNVAGDHKMQAAAAHDHQSDQSSGSTSSSVARVSSAPYSPKYKRRKNQHKRVVVQVSAEGLSSDMWAWRKYGQKPIKGSPYPRSYYRCSSSKGCLARKQVEQSCTDPGMFILTYTAEHSHSQPTRRNSLAGTVRQKFPAAASKTAQQSSVTKQEESGESLGCYPGPRKNPNKQQVQVTSSAEAEVGFPQARIKEEIGRDEEIIEAAAGVKGDDADYYHNNNKDFTMMSDFEFSEDFFSGLEEFDDFILEGCHAASAQQFPVRSCS